MIDVKTMCKISREDLMSLAELYSLAGEATEAEILIHNVWTFKIGEKVINVLENEECSLYLSQESGELKIKTNSEDIWNIKCNQDEIFEYFRAEFLVEKGYEVTEEYKQRANTCKYLRKFIDKTVGILNVKNGKNQI